MLPYSINDKVKLKKKHPCGADIWEIVFVGSDIKIKCSGCGRQVMIPRIDFMKQVKQIIKNDAEE